MKHYKFLLSSRGSRTHWKCTEENVHFTVGTDGITKPAKLVHNTLVVGI